MGKTSPKPKAVVSKSTGIKPYLEKGKTAFPNMMRRVTQAARDWGLKEKHSEMIKPYLMDPDLSYPAMDEFPNAPLHIESPHINGSDWTNIENWGDSAQKFKCIIHCSGCIQGKPKCCGEPIVCHFGARTVVPDHEVCKRVSVKMAFPEEDNAEATAVLQKALRCRWDPDAPLFGEFYLEPSQAYARSWAGVFDALSAVGVDVDNGIKVDVYYRDRGFQGRAKYWHPFIRKMITIEGAVSICDDNVWQNCGQCPVDPVMTFDDASTPDTIDPNSSISVYVTGGLGNYTWSVSGTGYTLNNATTSGVSNTLNCPAGSCGVEFAASAAVTVTDACGTQVTFYIRNTDGGWGAAHESSSGHGIPGSNCCSKFCGNGADRETITGLDKWNVQCTNSNCRQPNSPPPGDWNCSGTCDHPPPCGDSSWECHQDVNAGDGSTCCGGNPECSGAPEAPCSGYSANTKCWCYCTAFQYYDWGC